MPLRNKFELLSLVGRKKHTEEAPPSTAPPSSVHTSSRPPYQSGFHRSSSIPAPLPPAPQPTAAPTRDGFYTAVQYERLTPSVTQRPPVLGGSSAASSTSRSASFQSGQMSSGVQYERLTPSSARLPSPPVQYERLTPSSARLPSPPVQYGLAPSSVRLPSPQYDRLPSPQYDRLTPTASPAGGVSPIPSLNAARSASFPSPKVPSPNVLHPPVDIAPLRVDALRRERKSQRANSALASVAENGSPDVVMDPSANGATPNSGSDKSTPFSMVMEEWMSQLRTPTPDVMLLPSPFDFNKGTPTPVEKMEDIRHIHEALLPTPPPDVHDQRQVEDIASLCRDLITQEVSEQIAKRLIKMGAFPPSTTYAAAKKEIAKATASAGMSEAGDDYDDDQFDDTSSMGGAGGKGKRRKMCTSEGCQNLSRSRGLCKAHGGGRRCSVDGCSRASQSGSLCITHGGGKRCTVDGCHKAAQSRGMCKAHGGGVRCRVDGCTKSSQGDGFCRTHGGGRRCGHPSGCQKWAQRNGMCMAHSEGRYGNSYRGRVARMVGDDGEDEYVGNAAQALVNAASAPV